MHKTKHFVTKNGIVPKKLEALGKPNPPVNPNQGQKHSCSTFPCISNGRKLMENFLYVKAA